MAAASPTGIRFEGLTLSVADVRRSIDFYAGRLGFDLEVDAAPAFAMIRAGGAAGGTIGLLSVAHADEHGAKTLTSEQRAAIHVELSTDDLDGLYEVLKARGVEFESPPHDEPWERSMHARDPDGYTVEFAQGRRGHNAPSRPH
jgi:catechol 2,3-dioxygenase-like lactoylglutathione lyase family enzyme